MVYFLSHLVDTKFSIKCLIFRWAFLFLNYFDFELKIMLILLLSNKGAVSSLNRKGNSNLC